MGGICTLLRLIDYYIILPWNFANLAADYKSYVIYLTSPANQNTPMNMKLFLTALTLRVLYMSVVEDMCTLHRQGLLVVTMSHFMTICPSESLLLVLIQGLKLPNKPSTPSEVRRYRYIAGIVEHIRV